MVQKRATRIRGWGPRARARNPKLMAIKKQATMKTALGWFIKAVIILSLAPAFLCILAQLAAAYSMQVVAVLVLLAAIAGLAAGAGHILTGGRPPTRRSGAPYGPPFRSLLGRRD